MYQIFRKTEASADRSSAMECRDHSKNTASPKSQMSRGNFLGKTCFALSNVLACVLMVAILTACGGGSGSSIGGKSAKIKMTTEAGGDFSFYLAGSDVATVDWGDGSEKVTLTLNENGVEFKHTYPSATIRTVTVNGDNITGLVNNSLYNKLTNLDVSRCTELIILICKDNPLTSLDVSKNTALTMLSCDNNRLTSLDVSKNTALTRLDCNNNQLTSLDVSKNTALTELYCGRGNKLTSLDVSKNTALTKLDCSSNQLTSLNVNGATALKVLNCSNNQLTSLNVNGATALTNLNCSGNQLTSLNVSGATALTGLECNDNKLTSLNVSEATALTWLVCWNNQLTVVALNALFGTLHSNTISSGKTIRITSNPGAADCDQSIAERKGWMVRTGY